MDQTLASGIAGLCAGLTRVAISYPADHVRTLQQAKCVGLHEAWAMVGGVRALYRGASISFAAVGCERMVQFTVFEAVQARSGSLAAAATGGAAAAAVVSCVGQALLAQRIVHHKSIVQAARTFWGAPLQLVAGSFAEAARTFVAGTTYLTAYGFLREDPSTKHWPAAAHGVLANLGAIAVGYPLETLRIRFHTGAGASASLPSLYRGVGLAFARTLPSAAVGMTVYEFIRGSLLRQ